MSIADGTLGMGRKLAQSLMPDTCDIGFDTPGTVLDDATGGYGSTFTPVYSGPCEYMAPHRLGSDVDAAGQILTDQNAILKLPVMTSLGVKKNMVAIITAARNDPALVGTRCRITGPFAGSYVTARRFPVEVVS
ncbi:DUF6093 family protein [Subtercola boreus]|nr:DUF6093 family protein [Subtercola boreus]